MPAGRYFKYAIGEIVLVVIGILIALQINTWNGNRKASKLEQAYYCLLLEDIEQDKEQVKSLIEINEKRIEHSNEAIAIIQSKSIDINVFGEKINLSRRDGIQSFIPNSSTYEDIKSSGNINTLRDNNIRKSLNQYYRKTQELNGVILANMGLVISRMAQTADWFNIGGLHPSKEIFIIGGKHLYDNAYKFCDKIYLTRVDGVHSVDTTCDITTYLKDYTQLTSSKELNPHPQPHCTFEVWQRIE